VFANIATAGSALAGTRRDPYATLSVNPGDGRSGLDRLLCLTAAPTFAIMAFLTDIQDGGMPSMLCSAAHDASPLTGMLPMYLLPMHLLMSAFPSARWLRLINNRRRGAYPA
jgi:hypothetical protein